WPVELDTGTNVHFDASGSLRASTYRWDFDGDGTFETGWITESKPQRVYNSVGVFDAILEVRNSAGKIDRTERTITVIDSTNIVPEARLTIRNKTNTAAAKYHGVLRDEFSLSASGSRDRDGNDAKLQFRWDFEGDGEWDTTFADDRTVTHRYLKVGTFNPRVEVLDQKGGRATTSEQVRIVANTAPTASLTVKPLLGTRNTRFNFNASESRDDQSGTRYLEYRFDFDGDGIFDTQFQSNAYEYFEFDRAGAFTALVEVRDHANAVSRATAEFEVADPVPPVAAFTVDPLVGTFQTRFQFDASITYDPSGVGGPLKYRWDFDSSSASDINFSTGWLSSSQTSHNYQEVGQHRVCLTAKNQADHESVFCRFVEIHPASSYLKFLRQKGIMSEEKPNQLISRAELAKIIIQASKIRTRSQQQQLFTDVAPRDWYAPYVAAVHERGWISPKANFSWDPQGIVNRAEAVKIVFSALYPRVVSLEKVWLRDVPPNSWYARFANKAYEDGLIEIEGKLFHPAQPVTRGEVAQMVAILLEKYPPELRTSGYFWVEEGNSHVSAVNRFRPREFVSSLLDYLGVEVD
ncbi:MAG: PKD domain-containing protein, partial [Patescibacteria group bacterium]